MPRQVVTLFITTDRTRQTSLNREICYMTIPSSSKATSQLNKLDITTEHPSSASILTTWIRFQQLQRSANSNRAVEDLHLSKFILSPLSGINAPFSNEKEIASLILKAHTTLRWQFSPARRLPLHRQFLCRSSPLSLLFLTLEGLKLTPHQYS